MAVDKSLVDGKPLTRVTLPPPGRTAFVAYLDAMSKLVAEGGL